MKAQRGFVALLMMVLIAVGVFGAMAAWVASDPPPSKQSINQQVLMQAREALLAYVAVSGDPTKALPQKTRLPCPDRDGDGVADTAPDTSNCGITRQPAIGLLPWKTLGLTPLEDADGECLWYAVSGDFKEAADLAATTPVNADSDGAITVTNEAGNSLATKLVAVVFAPGAKLGSQVRTNSAMIGADRPCATPTSATPSGGAAVDVAGYLDSGEIDTKVTPPTITFKQLTATVDKQSLINDQLTWITAEDYAAIALQRNAKPLETAFSLAVAVSAADGRLPFASDTPGGQCKQDQYSGFLPGRCSYTYIDTTIGIEVTRTFTLIDPDEWQKLAFYAVSPGCNSPGCTAALGLPGGRKAKAVLLIRGRQQANQTCLLSTTTTAEGISDLDKWWPCIKTEANRTEFSKKPTDATQPRTFITPDKHPTFKDILKEFS